MATGHEHIVKRYDDELTRLTDEIVRMGEMAASQLTGAMDVLERRDSRAAERIVGNDVEIDRLEHVVSHDVVRLLALRQPMARDLREILAALRIASDIERIGDYASNAAKRSIALNEFPVVAQARGLSALVQLANAMLRDVLAAYRTRDAQAALAVRARDAELDAMYTSLFRELLTYMAEDPRSISPSIHLLFIAKNIERIGDHATNIAETVHYLITGVPLTDERPKKDTTSTTPVEFLQR